VVARPKTIVMLHKLQTKQHLRTMQS